MTFAQQGRFVRLDTGAITYEAPPVVGDDGVITVNSEILGVVGEATHQEHVDYLVAAEKARIQFEKDLRQQKLDLWDQKADALRAIGITDATAIELFIGPRV